MGTFRTCTSYWIRWNSVELFYEQFSSGKLNSRNNAKSLTVLFHKHSCTSPIFWNFIELFWLWKVEQRRGLPVAIRLDMFWSFTRYVLFFNESLFLWPNVSHFLDIGVLRIMVYAVLYINITLKAKASIFWTDRGRQKTFQIIELWT